MKGLFTAAIAIGSLCLLAGCSATPGSVGATVPAWQVGYGNSAPPALMAAACAPADTISVKRGTKTYIQIEK